MVGWDELSGKGCGWGWRGQVGRWDRMRGCVGQQEMGGEGVGGG